MSTHGQPPMIFREAPSVCEQCYTVETNEDGNAVFTRYVGTDCSDCKKFVCSECEVTLRSNSHHTYPDHHWCDECGKIVCLACFGDGRCKDWVEDPVTELDKCGDCV
jgi:hypothetical protein